MNEPNRSRFAPGWALLIAAAAIAARIPILLKGQGFFNSDEAVEGLMAMHIDSLPVFFWGQGYKGVPEVYLYSAVFAAFGEGVLQLKSTVLALWALAVVAVARLSWAWYGVRVMVVTVSLLIVGSPAMAHWSLSANAEVVLLTGVTAAMLLLWWPTPDRRRVPRSYWTFVLAGLALWIHPVAACVIVAMAVATAVESEEWRIGGWNALAARALARNLTGWVRTIALLLHGLFAVLLTAFAAMYAGLTIRTAYISATHPQRLLRHIAAVGIVACVVHAFGRSKTRRQAAIATCCVLVGAFPVIFEVMRGGGVGTHIITRRLADLPWMLTGIWKEVLPALVGLTDVDGGPLGVPWWMCLPLFAGLAVGATSAIRGRSQRPELLIPLLTAGAALGLLTVGGGFAGVPSVRYLLPFYGLLAMLAGVGIVRIAGNRVTGIAALTVTCLVPLVLGQYQWHSRLRIDPSDTLLLSCLSQQPRPFARADYWVAYRLTFLGRERVLVVPDKDEDRYPPYREIAEAAGPLPRIERATVDGAETRPAGTVICSAPPWNLIFE